MPATDDLEFSYIIRCGRTKVGLLRRYHYNSFSFILRHLLAVGHKFNEKWSFRYHKPSLCTVTLGHHPILDINLPASASMDRGSGQQRARQVGVRGASTSLQASPLEPDFQCVMSPGIASPSANVRHK
jgi:hypothetical protein